MEEHPFSRIELIIGKRAVQKLKESKVVVLGIGGVGSFAAEALARSVMGSLILVDCDKVALSNINRQIIADYTTVGRYKVDVMEERILKINPGCTITKHKTFVTEENIEEIIPRDVDYVIDAIDTVTSKIALAVWCHEKKVRLISSMGTGNKIDPTKFEITDIYKTKVCPLAKVMRRELKKRGVGSLKVLYSSEEPLRNQVEMEGRKQIPGSMPFVPPVAGMIIAGEVVRDLIGFGRK